MRSSTLRGHSVAEAVTENFCQTLASSGSAKSRACRRKQKFIRRQSALKPPESSSLKHGDSLSFKFMQTPRVRNLYSCFRRQTNTRESWFWMTPSTRIGDWDNNRQMPVLLHSISHIGGHQGQSFVPKYTKR